MLMAGQRRIEQESSGTLTFGTGFFPRCSVSLCFHITRELYDLQNNSYISTGCGHEP